jgi:hypothetical protein
MHQSVGILLLIVICLIMLGSTFAATCARGRYSNNGNDNGGPCTACSNTFYTTPGTGTIGTTDIVCTVCNVGTYSGNGLATGFNTGCNLCNTGYTNTNTNGATIASCNKCNAGYTGSTTNGITGCTPCVKGTYSSINTVGACTVCNIGYTTSAPGTGGTNQIACSQCAQGYYSASGNASGNNVGCIKCNVGYYTSASGAAGNQAACNWCYEGFQGSTTNGVTGCTQCPQGSYSTYGSGVTCTNCGAGYTTTTTATPGTNPSSCNLCSIGYGGASVSGTSGCSLCANDVSYKPTVGNTLCTDCDPHSELCGFNVPGQCKAGYSGDATLHIPPTSTAGSCTACTKGTYKTTAGNNINCINAGLMNCASLDGINCIGVNGIAATTTTTCVLNTTPPGATKAVSCQVQYIPDNIIIKFADNNVNTKNVTLVGPTDPINTLDNSGWKMNITTWSNGDIYQDNRPEIKGHFKLKFYLTTVDYGSLSGTTSCIKIGSPQDHVNKIIEDTTVSGTDGVNTYNFLLKVLLNNQIKTKKFYDYRSSNDVKTTYIVTIDGVQELSVNTYIIRSGCDIPMTYGKWNDPTRWDTGIVPKDTEDVILPIGSGVIEIENDLTIGSLETKSGHIIGGKTGCPEGWIFNPGKNPSTKCYKKYEIPLTFDDAEQKCKNSLFGSMDSHLVQISNDSELDIVQKLCRGKIDTLPTRSGCWIGLSDPKGVGSYSWLQPETVRNNTFRDWRRYEYNNHTFSEDLATNGELCVQIVPWQGDALIREQGSFNDVACKLNKPYVCQIFATTIKYIFTIKGSAILNGGGIETSKLIINGPSNLQNFYLLKGSHLHLTKTSSTSTIHRVIVEDGSTIEIDSDITTSNTAYIGELRDLKSPSSVLQMQSTFKLSKSSKWNIISIPQVTYNVDMELRANIEGTVTIGNSTNFNLNQGGALSLASFTLSNKTSVLNLGGGSQMSTYDSYELKLQHRGPVIGEYQNNIASEIADPTTGKFNIKGVFRLALSGGPIVTPQITTCIPYHSTAEDLAAILSQLPMVQTRGGITVRRYGSGDDPLFGYGYTYRIEMDAPPTVEFELGALSLNIQCYGIPNCDCAETKVPMKDPTGQRMCNRKEGNSSRIDGNACIIPPIVNIRPITVLSYTRTYGEGSLIIDTGVHRLPPRAAVIISSASTGLGIVGADLIQWGGIAVDGIGTIIAAGTGWASWDSASVLFGPGWWDVRGYVNMLETAPAFNMFVDVFVLSGLGSILTASPGSNMTWGVGTWNGGTVGGRSRLNVLGNVTASGTNKALRYGLTMYVGPQGNFVWSSGNISLANGASIIVEGTFDMQTTGERKYIGESHLLDASEPIYKAMLKSEDSFNWHGYFGLEIPSELRGGFYRNPLCGDGCTRENYIWFRESAICNFADNSNTSFNMPINLLGNSRMKMGKDAYVELASGGICGNSVVVDISSGTTFSFSGGRMSMRATCVVQGQGELLIAGGAHDMSFSIDSHITIAGGMMVWPFSRGPGATITFNGGLEIRLKGRLQIEPYSTVIVVYGEVLFRDEATLQFPMIGTAAQASNSDRPDAPDTTPRGSLKAVDKMTWNGGILRGKADFISEGQLFISGGLKQIRSMAKLVNKGYAEWLSGDILMADNADFMNLGTVQMANGNLYFDADNLYQGTVLPTENGGDVFAKEFHSYDLDSGWLSYLDYVNLRTEFVSRAPIGWQESDQDLTILKPTNII